MVFSIFGMNPALYYRDYNFYELLFCLMHRIGDSGVYYSNSTAHTNYLLYHVSQ